MRIWERPSQGRSPPRHILVRGSVGTVAAHAVFRIILVGQGVHICLRLHGLMECRIEGDDLRHVRKHMRDRMYTEQVGGIVQGREIAADLYLLQHVVVDERTSREEVRTLYDTVSYGLDIVEASEHTVPGINEGLQQELHSDLMVGYRLFHTIRLLACRLVRQFPFGKAYLLHDALGKKFIDFIALHIEKLVLDRRAAAIDY